MKSIQHLRVKLRRMIPALVSKTPVLPHQIGHEPSSKTLRSKTSMPSRHINLHDRSYPKTEETYPSPLMKIRKHDQDKFPAEYSSTLKKLTEMRQEVR